VTVPRVSIVLPVHNSATHLGECLASILEQSFQDWELLAADDASTDGSLAILNGFRDPRAQVFSIEVNQGVSRTRNFLIEKARSPLIALLDSDDFLDPGRLSIQINTLDDNPEIDIVGTFMNLIRESGDPVAVRGFPQTHFTVNGLLFSAAAPAHATIVGRRSWFLRNPYPEFLDRAEDKYMIVNAVRNSDFSYAVVEKPLYNYRFEGSQNIGKRLIIYRAERKYLAVFLDNPALKVLYKLRSFGKSFVAHIRSTLA